MEEDGTATRIAIKEPVRSVEKQLQKSMGKISTLGLVAQAGK